VKDSEQISSAR